MHLGHPERSYEMYITPHRESAMAMFGFVYLWYLMGVLVLEIWFDYRKDLVLTWQSSTGLKRQFYGALTLWSDDISPEALRIDDKIGRFITIVGIPSAFLLHGYVGFIFGSVKANPWWGNVLMPIIFIFSAIASGIALCVFNAMVLGWFRQKPSTFCQRNPTGSLTFSDTHGSTEPRLSRMSWTQSPSHAEPASRGRERLAACGEV
jgi:formate-dependent nitrite reductase membrane component NrfD